MTVAKIQETSWLRRIGREGPIYLAILRALEQAIAEGELQPGEQLPPQRVIANELGVDFTTVTRAYSAARTQGLISGAVGRGTFVAGRTVEDEVGLVDLSMNLPPPPKDLSIGRLLKTSVQEVLDRTDAQTLMSYHPPGGSLAQRTAGATWLRPCLGKLAPDRLLVAPGAQAALTTILGLIASPGDSVIVEPLTYPGMRAAAAYLKLRLIPCPIDDDGMAPDALARLCAEHAPKAIYLIPTLQNPTAITMSGARREAIAEVARRMATPIIEDDAYGRLPPEPSLALAALAPDLVWHIATTAKALSPGLRIAFVAAPDEAAARRLAEGLRVTALMASPLSAAVLTAWIREGVAERILAAVQAESAERQALARAILPQARGGPGGAHMWLDLPDRWPGERLRDVAQARGLSLVTAEAFAVGKDAPSGLRLSLGGPSKQSVLTEALRNVAAILKSGPGEVGRLVV
jgi:DNA-binding transcriptional MocR family regulator